MICSEGTPPSMKYLSDAVTILQCRRRQIDIHLHVLETIVRELTPIVALFVQSHNGSDVQLFENVGVVLWRPRVYAVVNLLAGGGGAAEGDVFARDDNVEVAVLDALVILIELNVKRCKINEVQILSPLQTSHAVSKGQRVCADTVTRVSVRKGGGGGGSEGLHRVLWRECLISV